MFLRLVVFVVGLGVIGCSLLVARQLRLQAVHELAQTHNRIAQHERVLWSLRVEVERRTTPEKIHLLATARLGPLQPISVAHAPSPAITASAPADDPAAPSRPGLIPAARVRAD